MSYHDPTSQAVADVTMWRHHGAMASVQIKNVPEGVHAILRRRAAAAHQSLQEYLLRHLIDEASRPTVQEVMERAGQRAGGSASFDDSVGLLQSERGR